MQSNLLFCWRCGSGSNRRIRVLQTLALPLGYRTGRRSTSLKHSATASSKSNKAPPPLDCVTLALIQNERREDKE